MCTTGGKLHDHWPKVAIALGSNLGDRLAHLDAALVLLDRADGLCMLDCSTVIETPPFGPSGQRPYLNAVCVVACRRTPLALLRLLRRIECSRGRDRVNGQRWGPRTLDLDLLLYADRIIDHPLLTVPHPRLHLRQFVLEPLNQVACDWLVPTLVQTVQQLLEQLPVSSSVDPSGTTGSTS